MGQLEEFVEWKIRCDITNMMLDIYQLELMVETTKGFNNIISFYQVRYTVQLYHSQEKKKGTT